MPIHNKGVLGQHLFHTIYNVLTSLLLFGLLFEVLSPWYRPSTWGHIFIPQLLAFNGLAVLLWGAIVRRWFFRCIGYLVITIGTLYYSFSDLEEHLGTWLLKLPFMLGEAFSSLSHHGFYYMDDILRLTFLLIGWTILIISLQQLTWQFYMSSPFLFIALAYLLTLHILFALNIYEGMLKTILYGTLLTALTFKMKRNAIFSMPIKRPESSINAMSKAGNKTSESYIPQLLKRLYFISSIVCMTCLILGASYFASFTKDKNVAVADWSKAITQRFINELSVLSTKVSGQPLTRQASYQAILGSGYGLDDSQLGGSVVISDKPVMHAWSAQPVYWRGEAKSRYTGSGWTDAERLVTLQKITHDSDVVIAWALEYGIKGSLLKQEITVLEPKSQFPLFHGGIKASVLSIEATNPSRVLTNYIEDEYTDNLYGPTDNAVVNTYTIMTELPITDENVLREVEPLNTELAEYVWQRDALEQYLQLPEELPVRVTALANEIASGGLTSRYDQVKAVEEYLKTNYSYKLVSNRPKENEDFVDHFLFEQQSGYCVHFASAMVVLLRSQDIPARYVKGYLSGEVIAERINDEGYIENLYEVSEKDAHAWVEVYFPGAGWVPFDPTPAAEEVAEAGVFNSFLNKLNWTQITDQLAKIELFVQAYNTYFLIAAIALVSLVVLIFSTKLLRYSKFYAVMQYKWAYKNTVSLIEQIAAVKLSQHGVGRKSKIIQLRSRLEQKQQKQFIKLTTILEKALEKEVVKLERKQNINAENTETMRYRIERLRHYYAEPMIDLLLSICTWIETIHYSPYKIEEIVHHLPQPKQLGRFSRHIRVDLSLSE